MVWQRIDGASTPQMVALLAKLAQGGVGLIITRDTPTFTLMDNTNLGSLELTGKNACRVFSQWQMPFMKMVP